MIIDRTSIIVVLLISVASIIVDLVLNRCDGFEVQLLANKMLLLTGIYI